jgi:hypothetical protein
MIQTETNKAQRSNRKSFSQERSGNPGWIELPVQPGSKPLQTNQKAIGGDESKIIFGFKQNPTKIIINQKKRGKSEIPNNPMDTKQRINSLIGAARRAHQREYRRQPGPNPTSSEQLGIRINILRRQQQKSLIWMSKKTEYAFDELVAFEAGILAPSRMLEMLPEILSALELNISKHPLVFSRFLSIS